MATLPAVVKISGLPPAAPLTGAEIAEISQIDPVSGLFNSKQSTVSAMGKAGQNGDFEFQVNGGGGTIATGLGPWLEVPFALTVTRWSIVADRNGSFSADIWSVPFAGIPPSAGNSITGGNFPTLTSAQAAQSSNLTGWNVNIPLGNWLYLNVLTSVNVQIITLALFGPKA